MDATFEQSFEQGNRTMPIVQEILGKVFFQVANDHEDMKHNTDLLLDTPHGKIRLSVRIRTFKDYNPQYKGEFTLCCGRNSGMDAEYQKIKQGYGDYIVYGFENETGTGLIHWIIGDLEIFRPWEEDVQFRPDPERDDPRLGYLTRFGKGVGFVRKNQRENATTGEKYYDYFYIYNWHLIPDFIIADSEHFEGVK